MNAEMAAKRRVPVHNDLTFQLITGLQRNGVVKGEQVLFPVGGWRVRPRG